MSDVYLLGFAGPSGVGKTSAATLLAVRGWDLVSFADPIKECVAACLDMSRLELEAVKRFDPRVRRMLRAVGDHGRSLAPSGYVHAAERRVRKAMRGGASVAIGDVRLEEEAAMVRACGGVVVHIERDGAAFSAEHGTEAGTRRLPEDRLLFNDGTIFGLRAAMEGLLAELRRRRSKAVGRAA